MFEMSGTRQIHGGESPRRGSELARPIALGTGCSRPSLAIVSVVLVLLQIGSVGAWARPADPTEDRFVALRLPTEILSGPSHPSSSEWLDAIERQLRRVASEGATHVVLPELSVLAAETLPGPTSDRLAGLARELGLFMAVSLPEIAEGERSAGYFVTAVLIDEEGRLRSQRRRVMPSPTGREDGFLRGSPRQVARTVDDGRRTLAVLPADDLRTGVPLLAGRGAEVILVPAGPAPASSRGTSPRVALAERLAREHGAALVIAGPGSGTAEAEGTGIYSVSGRRLTAADGRRAVMAELPTRGRGWRPPTSLGLPPVPMPAKVSPGGADPRLAELGRRLFFDTGLSRDGSVSCATCHDPEQAFANGEKTGEGVVAGQRTARNVIGLLDVAYKPLLFWDGYASSLENQSKYPTSHALEMARGYLDEVPAYVAEQDHYLRGFAALGIETIDFDAVAAALSAYQRTLGSGTSAFDRFHFAGDQGALSASARRGWELFRGKAGCIDCHAIDVDHALFSDHDFHNTGIGYDAATGEHADLGLGWISDARKAGLFFTPSLRNVSRTAPYMHDGSLATLREVIEHYDRGGVANPRLDERLAPLGLGEAEVEDLVAFLHALDGDAVYDAEGRPVVAGATAPAGQRARAEKGTSQPWKAAVLRLPPPRDRRGDGSSSEVQLGAEAPAVEAPAVEAPAAEAPAVEAPAADPLVEQHFARARNVRELVKAEVARVVREGARLVLLPEYVETGEPGRLGLDDAQLGALAGKQWASGLESYGQLARRQGVHLLVSLLEPVVAAAGSAEQEYGASVRPYHTVVLFDPDGVPVARQRKLSILSARSDGAGTPGREREVRTVDTALGRVGILSGDDLPTTLPRLSELGAELVLVAASWRDTDAVDWRRAVDELPPPGLRILIARLDDGKSAFVRPWPTAANVTSISVARAVTDAHGQRLPGAQRSIVELGPSSLRQAMAGLPPVPASTVAAAADPGLARSEALAIDLGRRLFFDPRLSESGEVACSTCHAPEHFYTDGLRFPRGVEGREGKKNTPTVINSVYRPSVFWRGDVPSLEAQVEHALRGWNEMNTHPTMAVAHLETLPEYRRAFHRLTGRDEIRLLDVSSVLASFERSLVAGDSLFDRWYFGGDDAAFDARQRRGFEVFVGDGRCATCHHIGRDSALFTDQDFHNTGVGYHPRFEYLGYGGDGLESNMARKVTFRGEYLTPPLRDIALTAPYMHDGSVADLEAVVEFYDQGGIANPRLDGRLRPLGLDARQKDDLVAFLETLTSRSIPEVEVPAFAPPPVSVASARSADGERGASEK